MRDYKNIICDINNSEYKMYFESNLNFDKLNKKQLLKYLYDLIKFNNQYITYKYHSNMKSKNFYIFNNFKKSFSYSYNIYSKIQICEAITTVLFNLKQFNINRLYLIK